MAGIEQLEIHSKSYIVRWVKVEDGYTVSWSVQPHKKSINFGIVKHPGAAGTNLSTTTALTEDKEAIGIDTSFNDGANEFKGTATSGAGGLFKRDASTAQEQLSKKGFKMIKWHGKCPADNVTTGTHDVAAGNSGMYGMVFDNTFSKQTSKNATIVLLTYPTGSAPQQSRNLMNLEAGSNVSVSVSHASLGRQSHPSPMVAATNESLDSLHSHTPLPGRTRSLASQGGSGPANAHTGIMMKRRRKKGQGYAKRFFSLDYATCTLSYYHNRNSSALRGAIPLSLAAIAADERRREISIDSGAEIWHLKTPNDKEFAEWASALTRASRIARGAEPPFAGGAGAGGGGNGKFPSRQASAGAGGYLAAPNTPQEEDREWQQVEALVSRVVGTRDALRRLVKDMSLQTHTIVSPRPATGNKVAYATPVIEEGDGYFQSAEKRPFWKRKSSATVVTPQSFQSSVSSALAVPSPASVTTIITANNGAGGDKRKSQGYNGKVDPDTYGIQDNCKALLGDLDSVVSEFSRLLAASKRRRIPTPQSAASRNSIESTSTDEFFDAAEGTEGRSELLMIDNLSEEESPQSDGEDEFGSAHDASDRSSVSSVGDADDLTRTGTVDDSNQYYPAKPKSLDPLPITTTIKRRRAIPPATTLPPSLIAFVRKNVGKDLSTISMPVSSNEPISLLQRMAEQLEYAQLLDAASKEKFPNDRLLYVTAFAVSQFSGTRAKERAIRKPFNPLLGETFEMLRADTECPGGMRLLVEKVSHRPVRLAMHADGNAWSFAQAPAPTQKFWGKSMELTTEGRVRVVLRLADGGEEHYSWGVATVFLRNVVMGEKYVEPVGSMAITNDTTGARAAVEFRTKGMFGGRGEDVQVETWGPDGVHTGTSLAGTWTQGLRKVEAGKSAGAEIWKVGSLVDNAGQVYGMTSFAASMNEITELEKDKLPPTDSRLRPDQRLAEQGKLDDAEQWKVRLEEAQRARRRTLEERGEQHLPRWFAKVAEGPDGDEVWRLKGGKDGYWEERAKGSWTGVEEIFKE